MTMTYDEAVERATDRVMMQIYALEERQMTKARIRELHELRVEVSAMANAFGRMRAAHDTMRALIDDMQDGSVEIPAVWRDRLEQFCADR